MPRSCARYSEMLGLGIFQNSDRNSAWLSLLFLVETIYLSTKLLFSCTVKRKDKILIQGTGWQYRKDTEIGQTFFDIWVSKIKFMLKSLVFQTEKLWRRCFKPGSLDISFYISFLPHLLMHGHANLTINCHLAWTWILWIKNYIVQFLLTLLTQTAVLQTLFWM